MARPGLTGSALSLDGRFLAAGGTGLASTELYGFATVKTDAADYAPGSTVTITGSGWQPGETVALSFRESPSIDVPGPFTATADASGNIFDAEFAPDTLDLNVRFYLTAVGSQSGLQAQNTFTDANDNTSTTASCTSATVTVGGATTQCTATVTDTGGSNGPPTGSVNWIIAPVDGSFNPVSCTLVTGSGNSSTCTTIFTGTSGGTATITAAYPGGGSGSKQWKLSSGTFAMTVDQAPAIISANSATFTVGTSGSFTVTDTGFPAPTLSESGTLPSGVTFNAATGVLSGTPGANTGGTYPITFTASNGVGSNATQSFTLTVNQAPAITSANNTTFTVGTAGTFTVTDTGFPAPALSESGTLPSGVTFNATTGVLSGTPASNTGGTYSITFTALNGVTPNATQSFTLTVNQAPAITSVNNTTFKAGTAGSFTVTATGFPAPTFSETGTLPSGVTLTSAGVLSGTPAANTGGTYTITITASNGVSPIATQSFTLTVNQAPAITSATSATFVVNTAGSFTVTASGFPAPTFSETGSLPSGVTLSSSGVLSGTASATGNFPITITASNGVSPAATQSFTLTIGQAPAITSANNTSFIVNSLGSFTATATGFPAPTFSETGALPSGVTFTSGGVLSGAPALGTVGAYPITITASNGVGTNATQSFTLTVSKVTPTFSALSASQTIPYGQASISLGGRVNGYDSMPGKVTITVDGVSSPALTLNGIPNNFQRWRRESCLQLWRLTLRESQEQQAQAFVPLHPCSAGTAHLLA